MPRSPASPCSFLSSCSPALDELAGEDLPPGLLTAQDKGCAHHAAKAPMQRFRAQLCSAHRGRVQLIRVEQSKTEVAEQGRGSGCALAEKDTLQMSRVRVSAWAMRSSVL